jgi:hypothetical protein
MLQQHGGTAGVVRVKKLMVVALGLISNREITIAMGVLESMKPISEILFVTHKNMSSQVTANGYAVMAIEGTSGECAERFKSVFARFAPDMIICADAYTMDFSTAWSGIDFKFLKSLGVPVGSFDAYEWSSTGFLQDFAGVSMKMKSELITESDFCIRPCPVNKPESPGGKVAACSLFGISHLITERDRDLKEKHSWRASRGILKKSKLVFIVNSTWEYLDVGRSLETLRLMKWLPQMIAAYLGHMKENITVFHIGGKEWSFPVGASIDYRHFASLPPSEYNKALACSDLFCGTNLISVTMSRAILCGVPTALFQNDKNVDFSRLEEALVRMPTWYQEMAHEVNKAMPFKVFPWGWHRFLQPVMENNPYSETFAKLPLFEAKKCVDALGELLFDERAIAGLKRKQEAYAKKLAALPPASKILELI